ncbi:hypothetical protein AB0C90_32020 [Streptomyces sp. NPDC048550]
MSVPVALGDLFHARPAISPDGSRLAVAVGNGVAVLDLPHP